MILNGKRPRSRHGLTALRQKVQVRGLEALDQRSSGARLVLTWRNNLISDLGGPELVSTAQKTLIEVATRTHLYVEHLDSFLMNQPSLVCGKGKRKTALPVLLERQRLADSLVNLLARLGLQRIAKPAPTLNEYLANRPGAEESHDEAEG